MRSSSNGAGRFGKGYGVVQMIVYAVFAGFGLVMLYVGLTEAVMQRRLLAASRPVEAEVTRSEVRESRSMDTDTRALHDNSTRSFSPEVRFRYEVGGAWYESEQMRPTVIGRGYGSREGAEEELRPFPLGAKVRAWVDPSVPERAFLVKESSAGPVVFIVLGVLLPPLAWLASRLV